MRLPTLHQHFGLPVESGLSDCLAAAQHDMPDSETIESVIRTAPDERGLDVLVAGQMPSDPSSLAWGPALGRVVKALREMDYEYILLDSPPILGIADAQLLARFADDVLLVARLDRVSPDQAEELATLLARLELTPVGLAVVGARVQLAPYPYYVTEQTPVSLSP
jgi:polysaccharide biosynthesis transport protein